ncbi:D-amino acid aminotransferase [Piscirickettsia salmonis]|uniref:D-amino acid aminotransferase n=1 Tax=Piscirickettsia salmonis TaxID=1238 RepID=UPI0002DAD14F|nr:D-amino acid aminotransferase [Piscirickettsia salmonis]APS57205.1 aminotransferase class IV family protein [Piscirickettsia salmonis]ERL62466.1 aminotransferase class IV family protein [Piscirickettsia salmonis LF-89 = ATCC VR-1361]PEQ17510.1 aminotransferase class IV family protein [Piscirickettsia salmonis]QGN78605.1 D-alanine aminotransferase [Piscirickettsia salmonis]QGN82188.1 D-alanine aminotransferase [Piscirickettsia salmonis]
MQAYYNGQFMPLDEVKVSPLDRGFLFGDGVYEVIPVYNHRLFKGEAHLLRLENSLDQIRIENPLTRADWLDLLNQLIDSNKESLREYQAVYLQVTRGDAPIRSHAFPDQIESTVFAYSMPLASLDYSSADYAGESVVTCNDERWQRCDIKSLNLLPNALANQYACDHHATEALLMRGNTIVEATSSNVFIFKNNTILTPPKDNILAGITRQCMLDLAKQHGLNCQESPISIDELLSADEVWLTSSSREVQPVVFVNQQRIADGKPGPVWRAMIDYYQQEKALA